ncbi:HK97 family phage prohead protease [Jiella sp. MQZ9-1]|uniref:HK97 family phage prohead protease n=1 Tax=Jiella flava TaxID=2816857 RepID=A0A939FUL5_9HYPH|nr:HK97 family phage prohead protease [Jiella flava]MBO0661827.1 HK97 family phage prohead protease [Jiella flava]MCD2470467.1 HK97 family phage prohead protease [Jiella flava]
MAPRTELAALHRRFAATPSPPPPLLSGYAALFGEIDLAGDRIERGAFSASLLHRQPGDVRMLWQHDPARPIGRWQRIVEDEVGLFVLGRFALGTQAGREAAGLAAAGAIDGLSIGFRTRLARRAAAGARRRLVTIDLWEISLVTFPMQQRARLTLVAEPAA